MSEPVGATVAEGYFDAATTTPLHPVARVALLAALDEGWADPDRLYRDGRRARMLLDGAREAVATVVGASPDEVSFTPSGTVAGQLALLGGAGGRRRLGTHVVASAVEHSSVLAAARRHAESVGRDDALTLVPVDGSGRVDPAQFSAALRPDTAIASLQSANHEVGTTQPVDEVAAACATAGVPLHVDAAQSLGRTDLPGGWSLLSASARKCGGPTGVGILVVRRGTRWRAPTPEDDHESGRMPGPVALPLVVAAAASLRARETERRDEAERLSALVERIRTELPRRVPDIEVLGDPERRLPHIVAFSCLYVAGEALAGELDRAGFAVSSGSSCSSSLTPSHVLEAMGALTHGNVRVSLPPEAEPAAVERFLDVLPPIVERLRRLAGAESL